MSRSACSGFVGMPVDGPARWMSQMTSGSSSMIASPIVSAFSTTPGPADVVMPSDAAERRADRRARGRDLVLRLERAHAELLVARELLEDRARRRDRVRAEEERQLRQLRRGDEAERERLVAGDVPVRPRLELRRLDLVRDRERLRRLAERVARLQRLDVRLGDLRPLRANFASRNSIVGSIGAAVQPRHQPEREHVLRALGLARRDALDAPSARRPSASSAVPRALVLVERAVLERVRARSPPSAGCGR